MANRVPGGLPATDLPSVISWITNQISDVRTDVRALQASQGRTLPGDFRFRANDDGTLVEIEQVSTGDVVTLAKPKAPPVTSVDWEIGDVELPGFTGPAAADVPALRTIGTGPLDAMAGDTPISGGGPPTGPAGGALGGTYPNPDLAAVANQRILGNFSGISAAPVAQTAAATKTFLAINSADVAGLGPYATAAGGSLVNADLAAGAAIVLSKLAPQANATILGNNTGGSASPVALSAAAAKTLLAIVAGDVGGLGGAALLNVGTIAGTVAAGNDARFTDSRPPTGAAGGALAGTYPNPTIGTSVALPGSPTTTTQAPSDGSTKIATTQYVDAAVLQVPAKQAVAYASTAALPAVIYNNGAAGVGATLTGSALGALSLDASAPGPGDRVLIKNQASTVQNGIWRVTATGSGAAAFVLTRATDFDQATDIDTGASTLVLGGATLAATTWNVNSAEHPVIGTDPITFAQTSGPGSVVSGNGITVTGTSVAIDTAVTVDRTTAQTLTHKNMTDATNMWPTFNQDTTGKAAKADALNSATTVVNTAAAAAPTADQVLAATGGTAATWRSVVSLIADGSLTPAKTIGVAEVLTAKDIASGYSGLDSGGGLAVDRMPSKRFAYSQRSASFALAKAASTAASLLYISDSTGVTGASAPLTNSCIAVFDALTSATFNTRARTLGDVPVSQQALGSPTGIQWDVVGGTSTASFGVLGRGRNHANRKLTAGQSCTETGTGTGVWVWWTKYGAGSATTGANAATVTINGVAQTTLDGTGAAVPYDSGYSQYYARPGGGYGPMTVVVAHGGAGTTFELEAVTIAAGNDTTGLRVLNASTPGISLHALVDPANPSTVQTIAKVLPPVIVIQAGINDAQPTGLNRSAAQIAADLTTFVGQINAQYTGALPAIIYAFQYQPQAAFGQATWPTTYRAALRAACITLGIEFLDLYEACGSLYAYTAGADPLGFSADGLHPGDTGHALIGRAVADVVVRGPNTTRTLMDLTNIHQLMDTPAINLRSSTPPAIYMTKDAGAALTALSGAGFFGFRGAVDSFGAISPAFAALGGLVEGTFDSTHRNGGLIFNTTGTAANAPIATVGGMSGTGTFWWGATTLAGATATIDNAGAIIAASIAVANQTGTGALMFGSNPTITQSLILYAAGAQPQVASRRDNSGTAALIGANQFLWAHAINGNRTTVPNYATGAQMAVLADAAWTATSSPARFEFSTTPTGSLTTTVRLILDNAGKLWGGATTGAALWSIDQAGGGSFASLTSTAQANALAMGANKITGLATGTVATDAATTGQAGFTIANHFTNAALASNTADQDIWSDSIAAATLTTNGDKVTGWYSIDLANNTHTKQVGVDVAGTRIGNYATGTAQATALRIDVKIIRVSNTVIRVIATWMALNNVAPPVQTAYAEITGLNLTTTAYNVKITGQNVTNASTTDIIGRMGHVRYRGA